MQQRDHFSPSRPVSPSAVDDHHRWSLAVTAHGPASIDPASTILHRHGDPLERLASIEHGPKLGLTESTSEEIIGSLV
jgi:hypothetical protein